MTDSPRDMITNDIVSYVVKHGFCVSSLEFVGGKLIEYLEQTQGNKETPADEPEEPVVTTPFTLAKPRGRPKATKKGT